MLEATPYASHGPFPRAARPSSWGTRPSRTTQSRVEASPCDRNAEARTITISILKDVSFVHFVSFHFFPPRKHRYERRVDSPGLASDVCPLPSPCT